MILNHAAANTLGGGWRNGALAQEESICYRSSLAMSLDGRHYPLADGAVYSPYVLVIRGDMASGHRLLDTIQPHNLPVLANATAAALRDPAVRTFRVPVPDAVAVSDPVPVTDPFSIPDPDPVADPVPVSVDEQEHWQQYSGLTRRKLVFKRDSERNAAKDKMRLVLRMAAYNRHRRLVLGALGCGAYANPPEDVAHRWLEVPREKTSFRATGGSMFVLRFTIRRRRVTLKSFTACCMGTRCDGMGFDKGEGKRIYLWGSCLGSSSARKHYRQFANKPAYSRLRMVLGAR